MTLPIILLTVLAIGTAILFSILRITHGGVTSLMSKTLASFCFVLLGVVVVFTHPVGNTGMFLLLGLVCGMLGDILLDLKSVDKTRSESYLNYGMLAFGLGHAFYITFAIVLFGSNLTLPLVIAGAFALLFTLSIVFFSKPLLGLSLGKFTLQVSSYCFMLTFAAALSFALAISNAILWPLAIALVSFWLSDLVLSLMYFGGKEDSKFLSILNHFLYYGAQIAIALFMVTL
ncbi:MAG: hypothetical protein J6Q55_01680 [Clostridia bacterium]|nr:hypothetical protein [Clostridia bacterium]